jgi:uncharacterized membrane protein
MKLFYTFLISIPTIFAIDILWLGVFAKEYYQKMMSPLVQIEFNWVYVVLFYIVYFTGLYIFALKPGIAAESLRTTIISAALFGFFCYATYDLTNLATLKNWPLSLSLVDMVWGTFLSATTAYIAYTVYFWLP